MNSMYKNIVLGTIVLGILIPGAAEARYKGEVAGWVPWFGGEAAIEDAIDHLDELDTIYPFTFEVLNDGSLRNLADFESDEWEDLFDEAQDERVAIIPTITWFEPAALHFTLADRDQREDHIAAIVDMVDEYDFDGVDIDYEGKWEKTRPYFSQFLKELEDELGRDDLVCTIEARTPPEDLYRAGEVPEDIVYADDYRKIDRYCDRVQIMAYDQQRAVLSLNNERRGLPYSPVSDEAWVEMVLDETLEDIDEDKVMLGIPTYGRAWDVTVASEWYRDYDNVAALNHDRIEELVDIYDARVGRTVGGEAVITYFPEDSPWAFLNDFNFKGGTKGYERAELALALATALDVEIPVRMVVWSDATAMAGKLEIADDYDLEGVSFFSINGKEDQDIWDEF